MSILKLPRIRFSRPRQSRYFSLTLAAVLALTLGACGGGAGGQSEAAKRHIERSKAYAEQGQFRAALIESKNAVQKDPENPKSHLARAALLQILGDHNAVIESLRKHTGKSDDIKITTAKSMVELGKLRSARETLGRVEIPNRNAEWRMVQARVAMGEGELEEALTILNKLAQEYPQNTEVNLRLAQADVAQLKLEDAIRQLQRGLEKAPKDVELLYTMSQVQYQRNQLNAAESNLSEALANTVSGDVITAQRTRILELMSRILTELGRTSEALTYKRLISANNPDARIAQQEFERALELYEKGNLEEAEAALDELTKDHPDNRLSAMLLGVISFQQQNFEKADALFSRHMDTELASERVITAAAISKVRLNRTEQARELLESALKDHEDSADLWSFYGLLLLNSEDTASEGITALEKALSLDATRTNLRLALAQYHYRNQSPGEAIGQLKSALGESPEDDSLQSSYLRILLAEGNTAAATKFIEQRVANQGRSFETELMYAQVAAKKRDLASVKKHLTAASKLDQEDARPLLLLGRQALAEREFREARKLFQQAIERDSNNVLAYHGVFTTYEQTQDRERGLSELDRLATKYPDGPATSVLADYYLRNRQLDKAKAFLKKLEGSTTSSAYLAQVRNNYALIEATTLIEENKLDDARAVVRQAANEDPNNYRALAIWARIELGTNNLDAAEAVAKKVAQINNQEHLAAEISGEIAQARGNEKAALAEYRKSWNARPTPAVARKIMGLVQKLEPSQSNAFAEDWLAKLPNDPYSIVHRATDLLENKAYKEAIALYERLMSVQIPQEMAAAVANNLAFAYSEVRDDRALPMARRALELDPDNPNVLDTLGWIQFQNGQVTEARANLRKALDMAPNHPLIKAHYEAASK